MNPRRTQWIGLGLVAATAVVVIAAYWRLGAHSISHSSPLPVLGALPEFTLTNQFGQPMAATAFHDQVWLADIVFTRCAGPCPRLTRRMSELQAALPAGLPVKLVTFTVDPEFDTPPVLKLYAQRFGAQPGRWVFLTGTKHQLYEVIVKGLKLVATATEPGKQSSDEDLFLHSTKIVLIDQQGRIRAYYDGLDPASKPKILADLAAVAQDSSS
ncbi:MAG: SCO family protein [Verrucomicrobia bacterium]|nr:SCO family protein [Verrucomicrobiota bacterium]